MTPAAHRALAKPSEGSRFERMSTGSSLFRAFLVSAALVLAGCEAGGETQGSNGFDTPGEATSEEEGREQERISWSGTAWLTVSREGFAYITFIDADGRYRDYRDGTLVYTGDWRENRERELCFAPDEGAGECWGLSGLQPDGTLRVADEDGGEVLLRRVTYTLPAQADEADEGDEASADEAS